MIEVVYRRCVTVAIIATSATVASAQLSLQAPPDPNRPRPEDPSGAGSPRGPAGIYQRDDSEIDNALGGIAGEVCWIQAYSAQPGFTRITSISTAWSFNVLPGAAGRIFVWEDPNDDGNPADAVLLHQQNVTAQNPCAGLFGFPCQPDEYTLSTPVNVSGSFFIGASTQMNDTFVAPIDYDSGTPIGVAWYDIDVSVFNPNGLNNALDLNNSGLGLVGVWMLRARGTPLGVSYQGRLVLNGTPVDGAADLEFTLYDALSGGTQITAPQVLNNVAVADGLFTVEIPFSATDFGAGLRYVEVRVAYPAGGALAALSPRQHIAYAPRAFHAARVEWSGITGVPAGFADGFDDGGNSLDASDGSPANVVSVDADGRTLVSGPLRLAFGNTLLYASTNETGNPTGDGFRLRLDTAFFGVNAEAFVFEKTDSLGGNPDGGIAFVNTANDGVVETAMVVRGDGNIGVGLNAPTAKLHIGGTAGTDGIRFPDNTLQTTAFSLAGDGVATTAARSDHTHSSLAASDGTPAQALSVDLDGNVGIGTTTPAHKLTIVDTQPGLLTMPLRLENASSTTGSATGICFRVSGTPAPKGALVYERTAQTFGRGSIHFLQNTAPDDTLPTIANSVMTIANLGQVGIGTTAPATKLHLAQVDSPTLRWEDTGTTPSTYHIGIASADNTFRIAETGIGDRIILTQTTGLVGIGRSPTTNRLEVNGEASKTTAGSWVANSDRRIKKNVATISGALETLDRLRLVSFRYTDEYRAERSSIEDRDYVNVIAQEFAEVFPDWVKSSGEKLADGSDILQVDSYPITIYAAAAVQELHQKLRERDVHIAELESRLEKLERALLSANAAREKE